jgi:hypothetical protein
MGRGRKCTFISATNENFEEFRERVYEALHTFTLRVSLHKFLYPDYKDAIEKKTKTKKKSSNFFYNINILILLSHH